MTQSCLKGDSDSSTEKGEGNCEGRNRSWPSWEVFAVIKGRDWGGNGGIEKWTDKRHIMEEELFGIGKWSGCGETGRKMVVSRVAGTRVPVGFSAGTGPLKAVRALPSAQVR